MSAIKEKFYVFMKIISVSIPVKEEYNKVQIEYVLNRTTEENIAKCFYSLFGEDFLYTNETIYHWNGIIWEQSKLALRRTFTSSFTQIFINCQIQNLKEMSFEMTRWRRQINIGVTRKFR